MSKLKLLVISTMVLGLLISGALVVQASYGDEAGKLLQDVGKKMQDFSKSMEAFRKGEVKLDKAIETAEKYKKGAFDDLKKAAELNAKADSWKLQTILMSTAERWYSATVKWHTALAEMSAELESLGKDMTIVAENMKGIGELAMEKEGSSN